jgi:AmiR/NasT family two-component response regulator
MPELTPVAPVPLDTTISRLVLVDSNDYTASILIDDLRRRGLGYIHWVASTLELPRVLESVKPDIVVVNYHSDQPDNLMVCSTIKLIAPLAATVVITSPGPALKAVRHWAQQSSSIDVIIEKPLSDEQFFYHGDGVAARQNRHAGSECPRGAAG